MTKTVRHKGVVTQDGANSLYQWHSFKNMIASVRSFSRAELESIVIWNRILVYAVLFGYADKVERALSVHGIALPPSFEQLNLPIFSQAIISSSHHYTSSASDVTNATNFSLSSGSSGISYGFVGSGGGGGGGAF